MAGSRFRASSDYGSGVGGGGGKNPGAGGNRSGTPCLCQSHRSWVTGADPKVLAAVIRGAIAVTLPAEALHSVDVPVLILNGKADAANQKVGKLLRAIPTASAAECEGHHHSTPYEPTFQRAVVHFFEKQWRARTMTRQEPRLDFTTRPIRD
jgi:hypothetical protein